jgi:predicted lipoprotein with Yx(FWY)xxD motif
MKRIFVSYFVTILICLALNKILSRSKKFNSHNNLIQVKKGPYGDYLTDNKGKSLYLFQKDNQGSSQCTSDCAIIWTPYIQPEMTIKENQGVEPLIGSSERNDGSFQVTYNNWPLYYYVGDHQPGHDYGQGYEGFWNLISPSGNPIQVTINSLHPNETSSGSRSSEEESFSHGYENE